MSKIIPFSFDKKEIRVVQDNYGNPIFIAKDLAEALGYSWNGTARIAHVPEQWRGVTSVVTPSGVQEMATLTEQGVYFFLGRSDKADALPMQMFVAGEVLPTIRKTGAYLPEGVTLESLPPSIASQVGGIIKAVVHKQIIDMMTVELPRLVQGELSKQSMGIRYGRTAGQIMRDHRVPPHKNLSNRVSRHLCQQKCQSGTVEVGGKPVKLFDPDAASIQMKLWMYDDCIKYIKESKGQIALFSEEAKAKKKKRNLSKVALDQHQTVQ